MREVQREVRFFMEQVNRFAAEHDSPKRQAIGPWPAIRDGALRAELIMEEAKETAEALTGETWFCRRAPVQPIDPKPNLVLAVDGLADIIVVTLGAAVALGVELNPVLAEVISANRRKFAAGASMRADGKFLKPPDFVPPDIAGALRRQGWAG